MTGRKRRHVIPLRLTEKELQYLNRQTEQSGLPREKYLRALIMGKTIRPRPCTHHEDLLRKVSGLCNNANQVAHRANSTGVAGQESVDKMIRISQEIWKEVKNQW
ncbi:plasmid mobilization relaxosome protein MobC [uncultured Gemmiger sp.]|uniref:plasmid mobilization protein n=1 Tax=uncultured Gemmiger sp. TaxID=1623490 RepID=UPI002665F74A|nr:plasmid mobilization relaxosome protein MobC [uncultured Gemmiger sp.]